MLGAGYHRNAVNAGGRRNNPDFGVTFQVEHFHLRPMRDVQATTGGIGQQVIPAAFAPNNRFFNEVIIRRCLSEQVASQQ